MLTSVVLYAAAAPPLAVRLKMGAASAALLAPKRYTSVTV